MRHARSILKCALAAIVTLVHGPVLPMPQENIHNITDRKICVDSRHADLRQTNRQTALASLSIDRQMDRQMDGQTYRQAHRQASYLGVLVWEAGQVLTQLQGALA